MNFKERIVQAFKDTIGTQDSLNFSKFELSTPENITAFPYHELDCSMTQPLKNQVKGVVHIVEGTWMVPTIIIDTPTGIVECTECGGQGPFTK